MRSLLFIFYFFVWLQAKASVDLSKCTEAMWSDVTAAGALGDFADPNNSTFVIKDGKIKINKPDRIVSQKVSDTQEIYTFKVDLGGGVTENRQMKVIKSGDKIIIEHVYDPKAHELANQNIAKAYKMEYKPLPQKKLGFETSYAIQGDECVVMQASTLLQIGSLEPRGHVSYDAKYCEDAKAIMQKHGKEKVEQCANMLKEINTLYDKRDTELLSEGKTLREPPINAGIMGGYGGVQSVFGATVALSMCSPPEWRLPWGFGMMGVRANQGALTERKSESTKEEPVAK